GVVPGDLANALDAHGGGHDTSPCAESGAEPIMRVSSPARGPYGSRWLMVWSPDFGLHTILSARDSLMVDHSRAPLARAVRSGFCRRRFRATGVPFGTESGVSSRVG